MNQDKQPRMCKGCTHYRPEPKDSALDLCARVLRPHDRKPYIFCKDARNKARLTKEPCGLDAIHYEPIPKVSFWRRIFR